MRTEAEGDTPEEQERVRAWLESLGYRRSILINNEDGSWWAYYVRAKTGANSDDGDVVNLSAWVEVVT